jgi:hypothetical protein
MASKLEKRHAALSALVANSEYDTAMVTSALILVEDALDSLERIAAALEGRNASGARPYPL